ncbi:MAG TPA: hypothetical protein V6D06_20205, partial [Trichocoleus sp.]
SVSSGDPVYEALNGTTLTATIADNDAPIVTVTPGGNGSELSAVPGVFTINLSDPASAGGLEVSYSVSGQAQNGVDYGLLSGTVVIPAGEFGANIFVNPVNDLIDEDPPESIVLTLEVGSDYQIGGTASATVTISDDDVAGVRILESGSRTIVAEGGRTDTYQVSLTSQPTDTVTVALATDNQLQPLAPLVFTPDNWNQAQTVTVQAADDGVADGTQTSLIRHSVTSSDANYSGIAVRDVGVEVRDRTFDAQLVANGVAATLSRMQAILQQELLAIDLPLVGEVADFAPTLIERFGTALVNQIRTATDLTQTKLEGILRSAIAPFFPDVQIGGLSGIEESRFEINLGHTFQLGVGLAQDLGLPALGLEVEGAAQVNFDYDLNLGFGIHRDFGFFVDADSTSIRADIDLGLANNFTAEGEMGFFPLTLRNNASDPTRLTLDFGFTLTDADAPGGPEDGDRITLGELQANTLNNLFDSSAQATANLGLSARTDLTSNTAVPGLVFDLAVDWAPLNYAGGQLLNPQAPQVGLNKTGLDLGDFVSDFAVPVLQQIDPIVAPFRPILQALNTDTKLFYAISQDLGRAFDPNRDGKVTIIEVAATLAELTGRGSFNTEFFDALLALDNVIRLSTQLRAGENLVIDRGSYQLQGFDATNPNDSVLNANIVADSRVGDPNLNLLSAATRAFLSAFQALEGLDLPILTEAQTTAELLIGKPDVNLLTYDVPELAIEFELQQIVPLFSIGVVSLDALLEGGFKAATDLGFGFDTFGLSQWRDRNFAEDQSFRVLDGFFISDRENPDGTGEDVSELTLTATIAAGFGLSVASVVGGYLKGGLEGIVGIDLVDNGEASGTKGGEGNNTDDGKIRVSEMASRLATPWQLFDIQGAINAFLGAEVLVFNQTVYETRFATFPLATFSVGTRSSFRGAGVDPYLAGANVFFDANFNGIQDPNEPFTISNADGTFDLPITLEVFDTNENGQIDAEEGRVVITDGVDISTSLDQVVPLATTVTATVASPFTTLVTELVERKFALRTAQDVVKAAFGLPAEANLLTFDPLQAIAAGDETGILLYARQAQWQNLLVQTTQFLSGATGEDALTVANRVIDALAKQFVPGVTVNLSSSAQLTALLAVVPGLDPVRVNGLLVVSAVLSQRIDDILASNLSLNEKAIEIAKVQKVAQGKAAADLRDLGAGSQSLSDVVGANIDEALDEQLRQVTV